ncbi:MAG: folylpolyglutamate synthase/dihydrofolate synthase family protein [Candidatus Omnitrophota bacterium]
MSYKEALQYLDSFVDFEKFLHQVNGRDFSLDALKRVLARLGNPEKKIRSIHIAGSKGKGSTSACTAEILAAGGYRVGLYTSPHLYDVRERIRILSPDRNDGQHELFTGCISTEDFADTIEAVKDALEESHEKITYFELLTAAAFVYFAENKLDCVVLETGLGGRLDATNVVESLVCAITRIDLEHTSILGDTVEKIAEEKAAIIKECCSRVVSVPQLPEARSVIIKKSDCCQVPCIWVGEDLMIEKIFHAGGKTAFTLVSKMQKYEFELVETSDYQLVNIAAAVGIVESMREYGLVVSCTDIQKGVRKFFWPARMEFISREPLVIVDGAHTAFSVERLCDTVRTRFEGQDLTLIFGACLGKDKRGMMEAFANHAKNVILTQACHERADPLGDQWIEPFLAGRGVSIYRASDVKEAVETGLSLTGLEGILLVTGSLFVAAEARAVLSKILLRKS